MKTFIVIIFALVAPDQEIDRFWGGNTANECSAIVTDWQVRRNRATKTTPVFGLKCVRG